MSVIVYRSESASYAAKRVAAAAHGLKAIQQRHYRPAPNDGPVIRWDCYEDLAVPQGLDMNPARAVQAARDKIRARAVLGHLAPRTWTEASAVRLPCVIRPRRHKAGLHFHVCNTTAEVLRAIKKLGRRGWYASELIDKAREFRVFVVAGRVAAVSERLPGTSHAIAWNIARGGRLINVNKPYWPVEILAPSIEACRLLGLGFGAVDVCIARDSRVFVFEVNTSPALKNKFTIRQIARSLAHGAAVKPVKDGARKPGSYQHPALREA